jgi:hypothetical protein
MIQLDGFRFRAPVQKDVYIMILVSSRMKHLSWDLFSAEELAVEPLTPRTWFNINPKAGTQIGDFKVPEEGVKGLILQIPAEALYSGKEYRFVLTIPNDGNNMTKEEFPGFMAIRALASWEIANLMTRELDPSRNK